MRAAGPLPPPHLGAPIRAPIQATHTLIAHNNDCSSLAAAAPPPYPTDHRLRPLEICICVLASVDTDAVKHGMCIGVGLGWQRRCKICQSLRELDNQGAVFFWGGFGGHHAGCRVRSCRA